MKKENLFYFFVFIFILLIIYTIHSRIYYYILDISASFVIITLLFIFYKELNLNNFIFSLIFLALLFHNFGVFGFYNQSPFPFEYDHLTHIFGGVSLLILFLNFLIRFFTQSKRTNFFLILVAFLSALGIGSIIEVIEYFGYLFLGSGQGAFYFGGTGDITSGSDIMTGAWINSSLDMTFNLIGALIGIIIYFIYRKIKQSE